MSYILQVFRPPAGGEMPPDPAAVADLVDRLWDTAPGAGRSWYPAFFRSLRQSAPSGGDSWIDAVAQQCDSPVSNIAIDPAEADRLVGLVVRCAREQGLAVLDPQAAQAWWPDGRGITFPRRAVRAEPAPEPDLSPAQVCFGFPYRLYCGHGVRARPGLQITTASHWTAFLPEILAGNVPPRPGATSRWMIALHERLVARFGRSAAEPDSIWAEDLRDPTALSTLYPIAVKAERVAEARPRIMEVAHDVDAKLYDPHAMQVFLPNGVAYAGDRSACLAGAREDQAQRGEAAKAVLRALTAALAGHGFAREKEDCLVRVLGDVRHRLRVDLDSPWVQLAVAVEIRTRSDLPPEAAARSAAALGLEPGMVYVSLFGGLKDFAGAQYFRDPLFLHDANGGSLSVHRRSRIEPTAREVLRVVTERVLPCLEELSDVGAIHGVINGAAGEEHPLWPPSPAERLNFAYLAGEPRLAEMAQAELQALATWKYDPARRRSLATNYLDRERQKVEALLAWLRRSA